MHTRFHPYHKDIAKSVPMQKEQIKLDYKMQDRPHYEYI
jgi:hypothetical protein